MAMRHNPEETVIARAELMAGLPVIQRLAMSYAPEQSKLPWLALFALDTRLAGFARSASEPLVAQLRIAWWRDMLARDQADWPGGEPILACLASWRGQHKALAPLVDGWEQFAVADGVTAAAIAGLAQGRAEAISGLAQVCGEQASPAAIERMARTWALCDIAARLGHDRDAAVALDLARQAPHDTARLSRPMRPLAVLGRLAARSLRRGIAIDRQGFGGLLSAMKAGLSGR